MPRTNPPSATLKIVDGWPTLIDAQERDDRVDARAEGRVGLAGRGVDVVANEGHDLMAEDLEHRGRVDVGQAVLDDRIHDEQEGHLEEQREAAREGVDATFLEQLLLGLAGLGRVALVAPLDLLDLGLRSCIRRCEVELLAHEGHDDGPDDEGQDDDGDADRGREAEAEEVVDRDQDDEHRLEDRREQPGERG